MRALRSASASALALVAVAFGSLTLAGCGPGFSNLGQGFRNPTGYGLCGIVWLVLAVLALLDLLKSNRDGVSKLIWILVIFFLPFVGVIAYYLFGRRG